MQVYILLPLQCTHTCDDTFSLCLVQVYPILFIHTFNIVYPSHNTHTHTHTGAQETATDGEVYNAKACLSARSCKLCLAMSIIAMALVLATLIVVLGELPFSPELPGHSILRDTSDLRNFFHSILRNNRKCKYF